MEITDAEAGVVNAYGDVKVNSVTLHDEPNLFVSVCVRWI
jgi:hypothetical protein